MSNFMPYSTARPFIDPRARYLDEEAELLPRLEEEEEELPQIGRPLPPQISPELRRIIGASSRPPGDPYELRAAKDDRQAVADVVAKQPIPDKPKWWQRLAAGAVGGLAGYTNAAGRTRVDPSGAVDAIMDVPGQQRKLAEWKRDVQGAQAKSAASERSLKDWQTNQDRNSANDLHDAQMANFRSLAERNQALADAAANKAERVQLGNTLFERGADGKWTKVADGSDGAQLKSLEQVAASVISDGDLTPAQKQAKLKEIGDAYNATHPEKPVIHWAEGKDGTLTAVTTTPTEVSQAGGQKGFGRIGKPQQTPVSLQSFNGGLSPEAVKRVKELSTSLRVEPTVKNYNDIKAAFGGIQEASQRGDGVGDLTLLRLFAKLTDPTTGVREEEYRTMKGAGGAINAVKVFLNGGWLEGQQLSPELRKTFVAMAQQVAGNRRRDYERTMGLYKRKAEAFGIDPSLVVDDLDGGQQDTPTVRSKAEYDALPSGAVYMEDGKKYRKP